jgi:hypothetical protein
MERPLMIWNRAATTVCRTFILVAGVGLAGCGQGGPSGTPTVSNPAPSKRGAIQSAASKAQSLKAERHLAQQAGIVLRPEDLRLPPVPPAENAAPLYRELAAVLKAKPLDESLLTKAAVGSDMVVLTEAEASQLRQLLAARPDVVALVHRVLEREQCDFQRDWKQGIDLKAPEYKTIRTCARIVRAESLLQLRAGQRAAAIGTLERGFRLGHHATSDQQVIAQLVGVACDNLMLGGLADIVRAAPDDSTTLAAVRKVVGFQRPKYDLDQMLSREAMMLGADFARVRAGGPVALAKYLQSTDGDTTTLAQLSPADQKRWILMIDSLEAERLQRLRTLLPITRLPYQERKVRLEQLAAEDTQRSGLSALVSSLFVSDPPPFPERREARRATLEAGAAVLEYHAKQQQWPTDLKQALGRMPEDPFTGQPLQYRVEGDGFVVYSVGETGKFDGGKPREATKETGFFRYSAAPTAPRL